jgi:hypothetical protein
MKYLLLLFALSSCNLIYKVPEAYNADHLTRAEYFNKVAWHYYKKLENEKDTSVLGAFNRLYYQAKFSENVRISVRYLDGYISQMKMFDDHFMTIPEKN